MALLWPWSVLAPLNPLRAALYFDTFFEKPWQELYEGALIAVPDMPASYLPHLLLLKLPLILSALGLAGGLGALAALARRDGPLTRRANLLMVTLAAALPVAIAMVSRPALYNGIRQFLFIVPPLAVLGGLAVSWLAGRAALHGRAALAAVAAVFFAGLSLPLIGMARLHPYEYVYFNPLAGGVAGAQGRYMLDYWGLAFKQAADALRAHLAAGHEHPPAGQALGGGDLRAAGLGASRARRRLRNHLRGQAGRLRHGAGRVLLPAACRRRSSPRCAATASSSPPSTTCAAARRRSC